MIVFLDTGVLGFICNPNDFSEATECKIWLETLLSRGVYIVTSEICDYQVRRGLELAHKLGFESDGIKILDNLRKLIDFLPITTEVIREAAELWSEAR